MIHTTDLAPGDTVKLVDFGATSPLFRRKLLAFGLTRGALMHVIRGAPLGCPLHVVVRGVSLSLRKEEACYLQWERA